MLFFLVIVVILRYGVSNSAQLFTVWISLYSWQGNNYHLASATPASTESRCSLAMVINSYAAFIVTRSIFVWSILNSLSGFVFCDDVIEPFKEVPNTIKGDKLWSGIEMPQTSYFEGMTNRSRSNRRSRS